MSKAAAMEGISLPMGCASVDAPPRGCLFCKTGKEEDVARRFESSFSGSRAIAPTRIRYRRRSDAAIEERVPLLPGYVFFELGGMGEGTGIARAGENRDREARVDLALREFSRMDGVIKLLRYSDGDWRLHDSDDQFAKLLFDTGGNIGVSRACFDAGNRIRILEGFLKDYEGSIVRVNRKTRTVEVRVDFQGKKISLWLGYELVMGIDPDDRQRARPE